MDVYLYDSFDGSAPGTLLASKRNSSFDLAGYHSVALDAPLAVTGGDDVIALAKITDATYGYPIAVDALGTHETGRIHVSLSGAAG